MLTSRADVFMSWPCSKLKSFLKPAADPAALSDNRRPLQLACLQSCSVQSGSASHDVILPAQPLTFPLRLDSTRAVQRA